MQPESYDMRGLAVGWNGQPQIGGRHLHGNDDGSGRIDQRAVPIEGDQIKLAGLGGGTHACGTKLVLAAAQNR